MSQNAPISSGFLLLALKANAQPRKRFLVLNEIDGHVLFFNDDSKLDPTHVQGMMMLNQGTVESGKSLDFTLSQGGKSWRLVAENEELKTQWIRSLQEAIKIAPGMPVQERNRQINKQISQEKKIQGRTP